MPDSTDALLDRLLAGHPDVRGALDDVHVECRRALDAIDPALVDLCRDRIAPLIGLAERAMLAPTTPAQRACLDLAEQIALDVTGVTDAQVATVAVHLGADGAATFVHAALVIEQRLRMRAMWERLALAVTP